MTDGLDGAVAGKLVAMNLGPWILAVAAVLAVWWLWRDRRGR